MWNKTIIKRIWILFLFVMTVMLLCSCGKAAVKEPEPVVQPETVESAAEPTPVPTPEPLRVSIAGSRGGSLELTEESEKVYVDDASYISGLIENSEILRSVDQIDLEDRLDFSFEDVASLQEAFPSADINYNVFILGSPVGRDTSELDLRALTEDDLADTVRELKKLPSVEMIRLTGSGALSAVDLNSDEAKNGAVFSGPLSLEDVGMIEAACPGATVDYQFILFGKKVSTADERLEYVDVKIGDDGVNDVFRAVLPYMSSLKYLKLDKCDVKSPVMAQLRDDFPDIKVVWRVYFSQYGTTADGTNGVYNCLTDTEMVWATGIVTDYYASELQYCTDVKYLDLGHNCITNVDFVRYMPNLEVAVLSISWLESLEPLASCPKLEYLECFSTNITDLTPLQYCTNLKHLNIGNPRAATPFKDLSPIYGLDLERLYCTSSYIPKAQQEEFKELHPDCECEFGAVDPSRGHWRFIDGNYLNDVPSNWVERYALLNEQFNYPSMKQSK